MNAQEMWDRFLAETGTAAAEYEAWAFGGAPDELAALVLAGEKVGTASAYTLYELDGEPLPKEGGYSVVLDSADQAVCVIQTTRVYVTPFSQVSAEHAFKEGEGDKSLDYWRQVHRDFFIGEMADYGLTFDESMPVVCEEFVCLYPNNK